MNVRVVAYLRISKSSLTVQPNQRCSDSITGRDSQIKIMERVIGKKITAYLPTFFKLITYNMDVGHVNVL